jgi:polyphosphate glucokinase
MVAGVKNLAKDWRYDAVSIGYPGVVVRNRPLAEPYNLGSGWAGFDFEAAFKCPVKVINDAAALFDGFGDRPFNDDCNRPG